MPLSALYCKMNKQWPVITITLLEKVQFTSSVSIYLACCSRFNLSEVLTYPVSGLIRKGRDTERILKIRKHHYLTEKFDQAIASYSFTFSPSLKSFIKQIVPLS